MQKEKEIGRYNVLINNGNLNHRDNRWYYGLQVDKFDNKDEWIESNFFYIKGHKDGNVKDEVNYMGVISDWLKDVEESEIEKIFKHKKNYVFEIELPKKAKLA